MKYLINADFRVTMKGVAVATSEEAGDFIYDTKDDPMTAGQMKEIAKANKFKLKGKKAAELKSSLDNGLSKMKLAEKSKKSPTEMVEEIVKAGFADDQSEDEILIQIVQSGVKFQKAGKMMQNAMIKLGLMLSIKDRYAASKKIMEAEDFEPDEFEDVRKMAKKLAKEITATTENQALVQIKKYCVENELAMPTKPKVVKTPMPIRIMAWITRNTDEKKEALEEWMEEHEVSESASVAWLKKFDLIKTAVKLQDEEDEEDEG